METTPGQESPIAASTGKNQVEITEYISKEYALVYSSAAAYGAGSPFFSKG
jgi:hypothetical protein